MNAKNYQRAFLDYYGQHELSPVNQKLDNLQEHFVRRAALYRHLGLPPALIKDKTVLEVGPGTGQNSLFTFSLRPKHFDLLDGNPESIRQIKLNFEAQQYDVSKLGFIETDFNLLKVSKTYDIVFCEGTIPGQKAPSAFLNKLSTCVNTNGMLVITCCDSVSIMADMFRKVAAAILLENDLTCSEKNVQKLRSFCHKSMKNLQGMSRNLDDWIYDVILHPIVGELFSIKDAIASIQEDFDVYSSSPQFTTDWRWYKELTHANAFNERFLQQYYKNVHNLLDNRFELPELPIETGQALVTMTETIYANCQSLLMDSFNEDGIEELILSIDKFSTKFSSVLHDTTILALREYKNALKNFLQNGEFNINLPHFEHWFSRGQQYLSFIKRPDYD